MKKIIIIGAALLLSTGAVLVANNAGSTDCPICPQGTCSPMDDCCKK